MNVVDFDQAISEIKKGQVLAYPTEAVWGLGCDPFQKVAFDKILKLKQRPIEKGVILLSESIERIEPLLASLDDQIRQTIIHSWTDVQQRQRATTWLLPVTTEIPQWIYGQHDRVAIRVTQHALCQKLCHHLDHLLVSTSANPAGLSPAINVAQIQQYFGQYSLAVLNGDLGHSTEPSRILDAVTGHIIRA